MNTLSRIGWVMLMCWGCIQGCSRLDSASGPDLSGPLNARSLPDTRDGVYIWADQLDADTDAENRFAALHYVGSQKLTRGRIDRLRAHNPGFVVVQYHKAYGVDQGGNVIEPNEWGPDISKLDAYIAAHPEDGAEEEYYLHWNDGSGEQRVEHYYRGHMEFYLADIRHEGYRKYMTSETLRRCREIGFDGTFFDVAYFPWYDYRPQNWYEYLPMSWPAIPECASYWNELAEPFWRYVQDAYHSEENDWYCLSNCGTMITGWYDPTYLDSIDGAMSEGFMTYQGAIMGANWELSASRILKYLTGNGKILIAQPSIEASDLELRAWCIANYLLLKNHKSFYYNVNTGAKVSWWPEYEIDLGAYLQAPPRNVEDLRVPDTDSLYRRMYERGLVLVNPGDEPQPYVLTGPMRRYRFFGGGSLVEGEKPDMDLTLDEEVSGRISVQPGEAMILCVSGGDIE